MLRSEFLFPAKPARSYTAAGKENARYHHVRIEHNSHLFFRTSEMALSISAFLIPDCLAAFRAFAISPSNSSIAGADMALRITTSFSPTTTTWRLALVSVWSGSPRESPPAPLMMLGCRDVGHRLLHIMDYYLTGKIIGMFGKKCKMRVKLSVRFLKI